MLAPRIGGKIGCMGAILAAAGVYLGCLILTKSVEREEISRLLGSRLTGRLFKRKDVQNIERKNLQFEK